MGWGGGNKTKETNKNFCSGPHGSEILTQEESVGWVDGGTEEAQQVDPKRWNFQP